MEDKRTYLFDYAWRQLELEDVAAERTYDIWHHPEKDAHLKCLQNFLKGKEEMINSLENDFSEIFHIYEQET